MIADTSFLHRLRQKLGQVHVPRGTLLPVISQGEVCDLWAPGYYHRANFRYTYCDPVSTTTRVAPLSASVRTKDGILVTIEITLLYCFKPAAEHLPIVGPILRESKTVQQSWINNLLNGRAQKVLQQVCCDYTESELADGRLIDRLETKLQIHFQKLLPTFFTVSSENTAVTVKRITPPTVIEEARQNSCRNAIYHQQPYSPELAQYIWANNLADKNAKVVVRIDNNDTLMPPLNRQPNIPSPPYTNGHAAKPSNGRAVGD